MHPFTATMLFVDGSVLVNAPTCVVLRVCRLSQAQFLSSFLGWRRIFEVGSSCCLDDDDDVFAFAGITTGEQKEVATEKGDEKVYYTLNVFGVGRECVFFSTLRLRSSSSKCHSWDVDGGWTCHTSLQTDLDITNVFNLWLIWCDAIVAADFDGGFFM